MHTYDCIQMHLLSSAPLFPSHYTSSNLLFRDFFFDNSSNLNDMSNFLHWRRTQGFNEINSVCRALSKGKGKMRGRVGWTKTRNGVSAGGVCVRVSDASLSLLKVEETVSCQKNSVEQKSVEFGDFYCGHGLHWCELVCCYHFIIDVIFQVLSMAI